MADIYYRTFGGFSPSEMNEENAQAFILPIPYEASTCYMAGTRFGPNAIIDASPFMEFYDGELDYEPTEHIRIYTYPEIMPSKNSMKEAYDEILAMARDVLKRDVFLVALGGEHSITPPVVEAFAEKYPDLSVLQFDAHSDLRDAYEGSCYSHACAMRRTRELASPVVQLGIRSMSMEEARYIRETGIGGSIHRAADRARWDVDGIIGGLSDHVYISFDLDGLDPSIMPSVGTPEPGGLLWYDTLDILRKCFERKNVVGCDVVELLPMKEQFHADFTAASLVYKMIAYKFYPMSAAEKPRG